MIFRSLFKYQKQIGELSIFSKLILVAVIFCAGSNTYGQRINPFEDDNVDLVDVLRLLKKPASLKPRDTVQSINKFRVSGVPAAGYTLQTGFAGLVSANAAFKTGKESKTSTALSSLTYTARNQILFPLQSAIWSRNNKYNLVLDWRYLYYPSYTYGLGGYTSLGDGYIVNYSALRLHQTLLRQIKGDLYLGVGYNLDYFWDITEQASTHVQPTDYQNYEYGSTGTINTKELASGITFNFLLDERENAINPDKGNFVNIIYRPNLVAFGNSNTWRSLVLDARKYIPYPEGSGNVLAFWTYDWLTLNGKPPYLMLPNTGSDPYSNTGRGYIQGRFRGKDMLYGEVEYRFGLTPSGLIGGVVFANAQSFTEYSSGKFETVAPGWGLGLRVKLNKMSKTNLAIDYGFGLGGSQGLFVNLGEVF